MCFKDIELFRSCLFSCDGKISIETEGASGAPLDFALCFLLHQLFVPALQEVIANFTLLKLITNSIFFRALAHLKHWYRGGSVQQLHCRAKLSKLPKHISFLLIEKDISITHLARYVTQNQ